MPKKEDILLKCYFEFPEYLKFHKDRLRELERSFLNAKNDYSSYIDEIDKEFSVKESKLVAKYYQIELLHEQKATEIENDFKERFNYLLDEVDSHNQKTQDFYKDEDDVYSNILNQFEERKGEAFNTYLRLTKETNYTIDKEMKVHRIFINEEQSKLESKNIEYQDLNATLSNKLLWTMEKAKNSLAKLNTSLTKEGTENKEFLDETINDSLGHLVDSREVMLALFRTSTARFDDEKNRIQGISKNKRKPHSELNQKMIHTFVKQIRDVNQKGKTFEAMIKQELSLSLSMLYPKIIEADAKKNLDALRKYILQKEIIEKKANYLLNRNQTMADLLISKYQNEIKKIKIDSYKRFEEIKLAYSAPAAFFQNSINIYSNFAFYLNETYEDLYRMLEKFKMYNQDYIDFKKDYIHNSDKSFEDYKIKLLVKVNDITNRLTEYISKIDGLSNDIVTLESNNRLEIAEIRKKMENLEVFGDYQKYIGSLENDQYFAMYQHNKNIEKIQIESNYTNSLYNVNKDVLLLNQNKLEYLEYQEHMIKVSKHEKKIHDLAQKRKIEEAKAKYHQKVDQVVGLRELAKHKIIFNAKKTNYGYAQGYAEYLEEERRKNGIGSTEVINFIHHVQNLMDVNLNQTKQINDYIKTTDDDYAYLRSLEKNRLDLLTQIDNNTNKKNHICETACRLYQEDINKKLTDSNNLIDRYLLIIKQHLLLEQSIDTTQNEVIAKNGYKNEISAAISYVYTEIVRLAYKYQIPKSIKNLDNLVENCLAELVFNNINKFKKINRTKSPKTSKKTLVSYYIETHTLLEKFQRGINTQLEIILNETTKNDRLFIKNTIKKAGNTKKIINKEYDNLDNQALKNNKSQKKQLRHLNIYSHKINNVYKKQVSDINKEYLAKVKESSEIAGLINKNFTKIVERNNRKLKSMLKFMNKLFKTEQKHLDIQFASYQKAIQHIEIEYDNSHTKEVSYIKYLYQNKDVEANKTIMVLENKISSLPIEKKNHYMVIKKDRNDLQILKNKELTKQYAEIERDKFVSRPKYLHEIEKVKKRLPDDYVNLYTEIQALEFEYLNQFVEINNEYDENYQDYILNQSGNSKILQENSPLYMPFVDINTYYENLLKTTSQAYKESLSKSKKTRDTLKKELQDSQEKQKRIINV